VGDVISPTDAQYSTWQHWADNKTVHEGQLICEYCSCDLFTKEKLESIINDDRDSMIDFCEEHSIDIPEDHLWKDRYETILQEINK
jgi:hypothetical protein